MRRFWSCAALVLAVSAFAFPASASAATAAFTHGVASGDVTSSKAIVWTRVDQAANIKLEVWPNASCLNGPKAFQKSNIQTSATSDFTIKVDVTGLASGTVYCYRFRRGDESFSPIGVLTTAPAASSAADVEFTYSGDSDGTNVSGSPFFNNFEVLDQARLENGNFFVYLGDTIYSDSSLRPSGPATTLAEYRDAYKVNREIAALPNLLKSTSTYALMDDHEVQNDYDGQTVNPTRYAAGRRAFLDYMPVRETGLPQDSSCAGDPLYRTFRWGSEVELFVLDERSCRSQDAASACGGDLGPTLPNAVRSTPPFNLFFPAPPPATCLPAIFDPSRTMLGPVQKQAFKNDLQASDAKYKIVISELAIQQFFALPYDRWEGYGAERNEILDFIRDNSISNVVFLTTDNHANLVNEVFKDRFENCSLPITPTCPVASPPTTISNELITGPIATNTLQVEVLGAFGPIGLFAFNQVLGVAGLDCRNLNEYSYGLVQENATAGTTNVTLKDDTGANVVDANNPAINCATAFGP